MHQSLSGRLTDLQGDHEPPCISLYLPTHRHHPDNQQDSIRYRNVLAAIESSLQQKQMYATREVEPLLAKFQALARDDRFWNHRTDALAILGSPDTFQVFELQRTVPELLVVADRFQAGLVAVRDRRPVMLRPSPVGTPKQYSPPHGPNLLLLVRVQIEVRRRGLAFPECADIWTNDDPTGSATTDSRSFGPRRSAAA